MPSLEVVWLIIGLSPFFVIGNDIPVTKGDGPVFAEVTMGNGVVFADASRCETVAQARRNKFIEAGYRQEDAAFIRCMPYWIDRQGLPAPHKRGK